jgi:hypothetical protein
VPQDKLDLFPGKLLQRGEDRPVREFNLFFFFFLEFNRPGDIIGGCESFFDETVADADGSGQALLDGAYLVHGNSCFYYR